MAMPKGHRYSKIVRVLQVRLGPETDQVLRATAEELGMSQAEVCRRGIIFYSQEPHRAAIGARILGQPGLPLPFDTLDPVPVVAGAWGKRKRGGRRAGLTGEEFMALKPSERLKAQREGRG